MRTRKPAIAAVATSCLALILTGCGTPDDNGTETQDATPAASPTVEEPASGPEEAETAQTPETTEDETSSSEEDDGGEAEFADFATAEQMSANWNDYDFALEVDHDTVQVITEVRHGVHDGYERVVLEYSDSTELAYRAQYEEADPDPDSAPASLLIEVQGTTGGPESEQLATLDALRPETEGVVEVVYPLLPKAEESPARIGLDQERPFRLHHAEEPTRIIIDIAH